MISLGIVDILLLILFILAGVAALRSRLYSRFYIITFLILVIMIERLAPGTLALIGNAIRGIDRVNDLAPHVNISPIITIR